MTPFDVEATDFRSYGFALRARRSSSVDAEGSRVFFARARGRDAAVVELRTPVSVVVPTEACALFPPDVLWSSVIMIVGV
jgi:hypothetical protein